MPKRKRDRDESELQYLAKKLKKLKRKIKRRHRIQSSESDSSDHMKSVPQNELESTPITIVDDDVTDQQGECSYWGENMNSNLELEEVIQPNDVPSSSHSPAPMHAAIVTAATTIATGDVLPSALMPPGSAFANASPTLPENPPLEPSVISAQPEVLDATIPDLDPELLQILGEDPTSVQEYGPKIQKDLAVRLEHIVITGLNKDTRKELRDKYKIPDNCKLIKPPTLNPEIRASLQESQAKRDKGIENKQVMTSCALSSLSTAITILLSSEYKNQELLKALMDTARTLGDIQHSDSILRRFFILSTVKKDLKDQLERSKIDETLFGHNLPETLKSAKIIQKSGADIKSTASIKPFTPRPARTFNRPLNLRAPPAGRRPAAAGSSRPFRPPQPPLQYPQPTPTARTATAPPPHSGYRTSSRQPPNRYKR